MRPVQRPVRVTFETASVTTVIELSATDESLTITAPYGGTRRVRGGAAREIADHIIAVALACAAIEATAPKPKGDHH